jgi:hypothetical protein
MENSKVPPIETQEIFEFLTKGYFISIDSEKAEIQKLHRIISEDDNYEILYDYFNRLGFQLINGNDYSYYYFAKQDTNKKLEDKLKIAYKWIDIYDFLMSYGESINEYFSAGKIFTPDQIFTICKVNTELMDKLNKLNKNISMPYDKIVKIIEELIKASFVEEYNPYNKEYKVLASFGYLELLIKTIDINTNDEDTTS